MLPERGLEGKRLASAEKSSVEGDVHGTAFYQAEKRMGSLNWNLQGRRRNRTVKILKTFKKKFLTWQGSRCEKVSQTWRQEELDWSSVQLPRYICLKSWRIPKIQIWHCSPERKYLWNLLVTCALHQYGQQRSEQGELGTGKSSSEPGAEIRQ